MRRLRAAAKVAPIIQAHAHDLGRLARSQQLHVGEFMESARFGVAAEEAAVDFANGVTVEDAVGQARRGTIANELVTLRHCTVAGDLCRRCFAHPEYRPEP